MLKKLIALARADLAYAKEFRLNVVKFIYHLEALFQLSLEYFDLLWHVVTARPIAIRRAAP